MRTADETPRQTTRGAAKPQCRKCLYYQAKRIETMRGECRRWSPVALWWMWRRWPRVSGRDWCGEFEADLFAGRGMV